MKSDPDDCGQYIVSYQNPRKDGMPKELFSPISQGRELTTPSSPTLSRMQSPPSPTLRRHAHRKSLERSEVCGINPS